MPSPSLRRPKSLRNWRMSLVSSGTSSSSEEFCANALVPPATVSGGLFPKCPGPPPPRRERDGQPNGCGDGDSPLPVSISVPHAYPLQVTAKIVRRMPRNYSGQGSGRFCGITPHQGLVQQPDHSCHDGHVGKVEYVPFEAEIRRRRMKQQKNSDCPNGQEREG